MNQKEAERLENISNNSLYAAGPSSAMVKYSFEIAQRYFSEGSVLELGAAEGIMTELICETDREVTVVEGSVHFCNELEKKFPEAEIVNSLFEDFEPDKYYDNIILGHVLEHVADPVLILDKVHKWLRPGSGRVFAAVPNSRSLHRQAAVVMGMLKIENELNQMDLHHGHRRVFDPESFRSVFYQSNLNVLLYGGYWLKPVSNSQIESTWSPEMLDAFMFLGERYPDIAAEIYVVANVND